MRHFLAGVFVTAAAVLWTGCASRVETSTGLEYRPPPGDPGVSRGRLQTMRAESGNARVVAQSPDGRMVATADPNARTPRVPYADLTPTDWRMAAGTWQGAPYRTGGTTRAGVDCSGFAMELHREVSGIHLPRTTGGQWEHGHEIPVSEVRPGDLLFFQTLRGQDAISHVGVVVGPVEFAHASTSAGVKFDEFDHGYWQRHLVGARRFNP